MAPSSDIPAIVDRRHWRGQRRRAWPNLGDYDFLLAETASCLADRLEDMVRDFPVAADLSAQGDILARALRVSCRPGRIGRLFECHAIADSAATRDLALVADADLLPFAPASLDLAVSNFGLHWLDDLPGALLQIRQALKPDGLFLAALPGGETLSELRTILAEAEMAETGGAAPRILPMIDLRQAAGLLQRAGFALPVADQEILTVRYSDLKYLFADLRNMGEGNALAARSRKPLRRAILDRAKALYRQRFTDAMGMLAVRFQILFLVGWAPHADQPKPALRGSGQIDLADFLKD